MEDSKALVSPKTYYDSESRQNSNFFFISYSHRDQNLVFDALNQLYDMGVNYWYDVNLNPGDIWDDRVKKEIENSHCRGAILFLSENSLLSNAVQEEIKFMNDLMNERKDFRLIPVIMGFNTAKELILSVANENEDFFNNNMAIFQEITNKKLWLTYDEAVDKIAGFAKSENVYDGFARSHLRDLDYTSTNGERVFLIGKYPQEEDGIPRDIEWIEISSKGDMIYLVSKYCLDFTDEKSISGMIDKVKGTISLNCLESIALINETFIEDNAESISQVVPTNFADRNRQQLLKLFWVLQGNGEDEHAVTYYNSNNCKIDSKIQGDKINAGVRLILTINNNKIGEQENAKH